MKYLFLIIMIYTGSILGQEIIGKYNVADDFGGFHSIVLKNDSTYEFSSRENSRFGWYDRNGKWWIEENHLIVSDTFNLIEDYVIEDHIVSEDQSKGIIVVVEDRFNRKISGIEMVFENPNTKEKQIYRTDENGMFEIIIRESDEWNDKGKLYWDLPIKERAFFSGVIEFNRRTDSVLIQYNENPLEWIEVSKQVFEIRGDSLIFQLNRDKPIRIKLLDKTLFVKKKE